MATEVEGDQVSYQARLDRSPEPRAFQHLGDEDRRMIYNLRTVVSGTRDKFSKLRDAVENKEKELEKEAALRKELEDRLQEHLVNMYNDDSVNEELRQRLPRANKDPDITLNGERPERSALDDIEDEITASNMQQNESGFGRWGEDEIDYNSPGRKGRNTSPKRGRRSQEYYSDEEYEPRHNRSSRRYRDYPPPGSYQGYYPPPPPQPYMPMYQYPAPGVPGQMQQSYMMHPGITPQQQSQSQMPLHSTPSGLMTSGMDASNQNTSGQDRLTPGQHQSQAQSHTKLGSAGNQNSSQKYGLLQLGAAGSTQGLDGAGASEGSITGADKSNGTGASGRSVGLVQITGVDPHRQITLLLAELDRLKEKNKKLNEEIIDLTRQLASLSASAETRDKEVEAQVAAKVADVIDEIYQAQKQRDAAMMQRLRLANEERDEAVMRFKKMQADGELDPSDYDNLISLLDAEAKVEGVLKALKDNGLQKIPERLVPEHAARSYSSPLSPLPEQGEWCPSDRHGQSSPVQREWSAPVQAPARMADDIEDIEDIYDPDEATIETMLQKINGGDSYKDIGKEGDDICSKINDARKRKKRITAEEMKAILEERDAALVKMKRYEQELSRLQRQGYGKQAPDNNEQALRAKLMAISQERDMALTKVQRLEDEMQTLRVYYSLHKSLSQEANLRDQFNNTLENITVQLKERDGNIELAQKENNILLAQLKAITMEKNELAEQLDKMQLSKQEADATIEKLQRLVNVLRRKINGSRAE